MRLRKIAYLSPQYFDDASCIGGGERYPMNLATGVVHATGGACQVDLISYGPKALRKPILPGVDLRVLAAAYRPAHPLDAVSWDLASVIAEADLVHFHSAFCRSSEMGLLLAKQQRKPIFVTDHGGFSSALGRDLGMLELADRIVAYSEFGAGLARSYTRTPIALVRGGVDAGKFTPPPGGDRPPRDRVLYVGRLLPHKGIDTLIEALPPDLPLTVCGRPYDSAYYRNLRWRAEGKRVEFVTDADDATILGLYRRAWVNVLPSVYRDCFGNTYVAPELMGFTLLEAMACGTPAICSRVGAMPEYVRHGETGFVFDTVEELTDQLTRLATEPGLADRMGDRARRSVVEEFSLEVAGARMLAVYEEVIARAREEAA